MTNRNLYKDVKDVKFSPDQTVKLYNARSYIHGLTNQSKINVPFTGQYKGDFLLEADVRNMKIRLDNFINIYGKKPAYVNVIPPTTTPSISTSKKGKYLTSFEKEMGAVKNIKEATDKVRSTGYDGYLNAYRNSGSGKVFDVYKRLGKKTPQNCCDLTAGITTLAIDMGYDAQAVQIQCSNVTHLICRVRGKELGNIWNWIDIAPMASKTNSYVSFGKVDWCATSSGHPKQVVAYNPKWFINMYLDDLLV